MGKPTLIETREVALGDIHIEERLRPTDPVAVQSLMQSIEEIGLQDHIHLRRVRLRTPLRYSDEAGQDHKITTALRLMAGAHRFEAFFALGIDAIPAKIWDCTDDYARLIEIDDNLARADLQPLDLAVFLAERTRVYEGMYPQAKRATGAALASKRWDAADTMSVASFVRSTSEQMGQSERNIRRLVAGAEALRPDDINYLRQSPQRVTLADLTTIAKATPDERPIICRDLGLGKVKSAKEVINRRKAPGAKVQTPTDAQYFKIDDAWVRASKAARAQFVRNHADELRALLNDAADAAPAAFATRRGDNAKN